MIVCLQKINQNAVQTTLENDGCSDGSPIKQEIRTCPSKRKETNEVNNVEIQPRQSETSTNTFVSWETRYSTVVVVG